MTETRWTRWAAGAGLLFVIFLVTSFFLISTPQAGDSATTIGHYYQHHDKVVKVSGLLTMLAVFVGVWFYTLIWRYFRSFPGQEVPATASLVGAAIFAMSGVVTAGLDFAFTDKAKHIGAGAFIALNQLAADLTYPMSVVGLALFYAGAGLVIRRTRAFPGWLAWVSFVLALVAFAGPIGFVTFAFTPIWVLIVVVMLFRMPAETLAPDAT